MDVKGRAHLERRQQRLSVGHAIAVPRGHPIAVLRSAYREPVVQPLQEAGDQSEGDFRGTEHRKM